MSWFGWSSGGSSPSRPPAKPSKAARDALPGLDFDPDAPVHFDDGDLEDPELLAELSALSGGKRDSDDEDLANLTRNEAPKAKVQPRATASPARKPVPVLPPVEPDSDHEDNIPTDHIEVVLPEGLPTDPEADIHVEFNEDDENDPELLAELSKVHSSVAGPVAPIPPTAPSPVSAPVPVSRKEPTPNAPEEPSLERKLASTDPAILSRFAEQEKVKALNYKRTGDADSARNSLLASKQLEARAQELLQAAAAKTPGAPDPRLALAQRRLTDYKQAALAAKNAGDLSRARDMLVTSKKIAEAIDGGLPAGWELPTPPSSRPAAKPANAGSVSARLVPKPQSASAPKGQGLGTTSLPDDTPPPSIPTDLPGYLLTSLRNQITACTNASAFAFKRGDKQTALHFHKLKKLFTTDLATIEALKNSGAPPPPFRTETVSYKLERQNGDLEPGECEVAIIRCEGLVAKDVKASDLDVACTFDFGYPVENDATKPEGKGETPAQRGPDPVFDFTKTVPIDRTSRALIRHFEKRKLAIELYHNRGWFRGRALIARASISLSDLLSKCEIHELAPLTDPANPRRAIGGRIEVKVRLRTPARGPEVVEVVERWVSLDVGDGRDAVTVPRATTPVPADLPVTSVATPQKAAPLADMNIVQAPSPARGGPAVAAQPLTPIPATPPAPRTPPSVSSTQPPVQTAQSAEEIDDLIASFDSADGLASNAVVEHEMQLADARFAGAKTSTEKEEAADRKNALKIRETVLVTMVQTGKLTMDGYLAQLQVAIADCKKMALRFKGMQRLDYAKKALERAKLMEREAAEVEEMIRSEAGEG